MRGYCNSRELKVTLRMRIIIIVVGGKEVPSLSSTVPFFGLHLKQNKREVKKRRIN